MCLHNCKFFGFPFIYIEEFGNFDVLFVLFSLSFLTNVKGFLIHLFVIIFLLFIKKAYLWLYLKQQIFEDVKAALDLWLCISCLDHFEEGEYSALFDNIIILLYNIIDLLHLKVCFSS